MSEIDIPAERQNGSSATAKYEMPDTVAGMTEKFGEDVVYSHVKRSLVIAIQAYMRPMIDAGKSAEEIQTAVTDWKPGVKKAAKSPLERAREELTKMSPADRKALMSELRSRKDEVAAAPA
jgi:hypothetical protein